MQIVIGVQLDADQVERLGAVFPDLEFTVATDPEAIRAALPGCEVYFGNRSLPDVVELAPNLRWVQTYSAGVNGLPFAALEARHVLLTNASGAHGVPISENILSMMLAFAIGLPWLVRAQSERAWNSRVVAERKFDLDGQTLLVAGLGGIGSVLARKAKGLGLHVVGTRHRPLPAPPGVDELVPRDGLIEALGRADHVALCLPLTENTTGFLGERELRAMQSTAYVYNVGRGQSIDREALLRALREGWIGGAGLDVTDPEPLTPDDPLWTFPNVILSQHTSGHSPFIDRRVTDIFIDNLRRYRAGMPLVNVVDYGRGY